MLAADFQLVWRSAPSYSFRRTEYTERDFRTNEKFAAVHAGVQRILSTLPAGENVGLHDTFAITYPRRGREGEKIVKEL